MTMYIPDEWIKRKENKQRVHDILNKYFYTDLCPINQKEPANLAKKELTDIGETTVIKKIEDGTLIFS